MQQQFLTPESVPNSDLKISVPETRTDNDSVAGQTQSQAAAVLLTTVKRKIRRRKTKFWGAFVLLECSNLLIFVPQLLGWGHISNLGLLLPFLVTITLACVMMIYTVFRPVDFDTEELARVGGTRAIPSLLDALNSGMSPSVRKTVYRALAGLLPQMQASDANLLTVRHRRILNYLLNAEAWPGMVRKPQADFIVAVLKAYEQVGDVKAIPVVTKLANGVTRTERQRAVQQAAQECLPLLQGNTAPLGHSQTLLRAADSFHAAPDVLLRPAVGAATVPVEELLRSSSDQT